MKKKLYFILNMSFFEEIAYKRTAIFSYCKMAGT